MSHSDLTWRMRYLLIAALFAFIGLALYARVVAYGPFLFDDAEYIIDNPFSRDISSILSLNDTRQLGYLSFAVNYSLGGEVPFGYHLFNVLVHIANGLLVVCLVVQILRRLNNDEDLPGWSVQAATFAGMLFLVHPLQTQSVSYITQRFTSLAALFYLLSVVAYLIARRYIERRERPAVRFLAAALSVLGAIAAMRTKEISITIPCVLVLLEVLLYKGSRLGRKRFFLLLPFALATLTIPLAIFGPELGMTRALDGIADVIRTDKIHDLTQRSPSQYLFTQFRVIVIYLRLLVLPVGQKVIYDIPVSKSFFEPSVMASLFLLVLLGAGAWYAWRMYLSSDHRSDVRLVYGLAAIGILWFFVTLSVESSVLPIKDVIFEHRAYLPSAGIFAGASISMVYGVFRMLQRRTVTAAVLGLIVILPLSIGTVLRNEVWTDDIKFWNDVVTKAPRKAIGYSNRAAAFAMREEYGKALVDFDRVISLFPRSTEDLFKWENADISPWNMSKSYRGRGNVHLVLGEPDKAAEDFRRAREVFAMPVDTEDLLIEADILSKKSRYREALWIYERILEWDPLDVRALNDRANAFVFMGRFPEAISDLTRVIALDPSYIIAYHNRGIAYARAGKQEKAVADFRQACKKGFEPACDNIEYGSIPPEQY